MACFKVVNRFKNSDINLLPRRKTTHSAGYDLVAAEDTIVPSIWSHLEVLKLTTKDTYNLKDVATITKSTGVKPTLVSTGLKCCGLAENEYLELSVRSSTPLKYWLMLANGVGIIDADYADNPGNEGEIYLQLINLAPFDIRIQKGEAIGQGIIKNYLITDDDVASGRRIGGFGSTTA